MHVHSTDCNLEVFFQNGTREQSHLLPMHSITAHLGNDVCTALVGLHSCTSCDSISSLCAKWKTESFQAGIGVAESPRCNASARSDVSAVR